MFATGLFQFVLDSLRNHNFRNKYDIFPLISLAMCTIIGFIFQQNAQLSTDKIVYENTIVTVHKLHVII